MSTPDVPWFPAPPETEFFSGGNSQALNGATALRDAPPVPVLRSWGTGPAAPICLLARIASERRARPRWSHGPAPVRMCPEARRGRLFAVRECGDTHASLGLIAGRSGRAPVSWFQGVREPAVRHDRFRTHPTVWRSNDPRPLERPWPAEPAGLPQRPLPLLPEPPRDWKPF